MITEESGFSNLLQLLGQKHQKELHNHSPAISVGLSNSSIVLVVLKKGIGGLQMDFLYVAVLASIRGCAEWWCPATFPQWEHSSEHLSEVKYASDEANREQHQKKFSWIMWHLCLMDKQCQMRTILQLCYLPRRQPNWVPFCLSCVVAIRRGEGSGRKRTREFHGVCSRRVR